MTAAPLVAALPRNAVCVTAKVALRTSMPPPEVAVETVEKASHAETVELASVKCPTSTEIAVPLADVWPVAEQRSMVTFVKVTVGGKNWCSKASGHMAKSAPADTILVPSGENDTERM